MMGDPKQLLLFVLGLAVAGRICAAAEPANESAGNVLAGNLPATIGAAERDARGVLAHTVRSPRQGGPTRLRVLPPRTVVEGRRYAVVYLLPVEAQDESRYGSALDEVLRGGLAERHGVIFVAPTFWHLPWYADHPTDRTIAQESYLLEDVLPFVERTYPALAEPRGRLLLGFSKSGWGAWSLLLRHPDRFGRAAAWDAPFRMREPGAYGSGPIFGTAENFARYDVRRLLARPELRLGDDKRLILLGYDAFRQDHVTLHAELERLQIAHDYRDGPQRKHDWHSGWLAEALALLLAPNAPR